MEEYSSKRMMLKQFIQHHECNNLYRSSIQNTDSFLNNVGLYFCLRIVNVDAFIVIIMLELDLIMTFYLCSPELLYLYICWDS